VTERPSRPAAVAADAADGWQGARDAGPTIGHSLLGASRARRRNGWLIGATVALLVIVGAVATRALLTNGSSANSGRLSADTGSASTKPSTSAPASPTQNPITPAAFVGAWSGIVRQPPTDTYYVNVTFTSGTSAGTVSYAGTGFSCSGTLTLTQVKGQQLTLSQGIIQGQSNCENGQVTVTLTGPGKIMFSFRSNGPVAAGTLTRQAG